MSRTPWSRPALNALDLLYRAGWRWAAISAHVSAVDGIERTPKACRRKASDIRLTTPAGKAWRAYDHLLDDLYDLMVLDYSAAEIVDALEGQHGVRLTPKWVGQAGKRLPSGVLSGWKARRHGRMARRKVELNQQRRAAA